jgi:threonine dehydratase
LAKRYAHVGVREVALMRLAGDPAHRTWIAVESMQVTGSFKVRGALLAIEAMAERGSGERPRFVAASAGNHGAGVAFAAKHLGAEATIVVPRGAPRTKVAKMTAAGATVIEAASPGYDDAEREAMGLARSRGVPFLSPYDDLDVLLGNGASLGFEIAEALGRSPDLVHCPIGGGGLAAGLASALGPPTRVVPVQSEASCAFASSLERGEAVTELAPAETLAEGLEGGISRAAFARARAVIDTALVCTEAEIASAMRWGFFELGLVLEGSAAVSLVPWLAPEPALRTSSTESDTVLVLTGRNVDPERLVRVVS